MSAYILDVKFEHRHDWLGIGQSRPRISWTFGCDNIDVKDWKQQSYEIELKGEGREIRTYHTPSRESSLVPWPMSAPDLKSGESVAVRVKSTGGQPLESTPWSSSYDVEAGLLLETDWQCQIIYSPKVTEPDAPHKPILFRRKIVAAHQIKRARLYATSFGVYEIEINGRRVGDQVLAPGWQNYTHRLEYQTYDVTSHFHQGDNVVGAHVAEGWYAGRLGFFGGGRRNIWGNRLAFMSIIHVTYENGNTEIVATDENWRCSSGAIASSEIYNGEKFDARLECPNWSTSEHDEDESAWEPVDISPIEDISRKLVAPDGPPVRRIETLAQKAITKSPSGKWIVDFGQNLVGRLEVQVPAGGENGQCVKFTHVEVLEHGECAIRPLRTAEACDVVTLSGEAFIWEAKFTFHGFRYVQVENWPTSDGRPSDDSIKAIVLHTDMERIGHLECSNPLLNQLHSNVVWGMRGNFLSVPTDCPQRDERLGWTGDIQAFCPTANYLYETTGMLAGWLRGLAAETLEDGGCVPPLVSPNVLGQMGKPPNAIWSDVLISVPWDVFQSSGDHEVLSTQYESMKAWLDRGVPRDDRGAWHQEYALQLGDWLDPIAPPDAPGNGQTDGLVVANAFLIQMTDLMSKISLLLGNEGDSKRYLKEAITLRECFNNDYITPSGNVSSDSQTALALAIKFSLFSTLVQEKHAAQRLEFLIRAKSKFKIATGFAGTPIIGHALTKVGKSQLFYRMLLHKKCPSWLYPVTMGATTIWERWDSMLPNGDINPGGMTSFNHYALGSVAQWVHEVMGGLSALTPGWSKILIGPIPGGGLTWTTTRHLTPYGWATVEWKILDDIFVLDISIPPNTSADVYLPDEIAPKTIGSGTYHFESAYKSLEWPILPIYAPFSPHDDDEP